MIEVLLWLAWLWFAAGLVGVAAHWLRSDDYFLKRRASIPLGAQVHMLFLALVTAALAGPICIVLYVLERTSTAATPWNG